MKLEDISADDFFIIANIICANTNQNIDLITATTILSVKLGVADDSRSIANKLGIAHALVLRAINQNEGLLFIIKQNQQRNQRKWLELNDYSNKLSEMALSEYNQAAA